MYIVKLNDIHTGEIFFKIGKTFTQLNSRFKSIPYTKEIIKIYDFKSAKECSEFETYLKKENKQHINIPLKSFAGQHECFSQLTY